jgi:hypothetical protein
VSPAALLQVRGLQVELAAERAARGDAQAALEALVRQQPPAAPAAESPPAAAAAAGPDGSAYPLQEPDSPCHPLGTGGQQQPGTASDIKLAQHITAELHAERRRLQQAQRSNAALRANLRQTQAAAQLLRASLEAECAAAAATQAADAAELRQLAERLQHVEAARDEAVQARGATTL